MKIILKNLSLVSLFVASLNVTSAPIWLNKLSGGDDVLLGTVHMGDQSLESLPDIIKQQVDAVDIVVVETHEDDSAMSALIAELALLPQHQSLQQVLQPDTYEKLEKRLRFYGDNINNYRQLKPWMVSMILSVKMIERLGLKPDNGIDEQVIKYAKQRGKKIVALETNRQQLGFFNDIILANPSLTGDDFITAALQDLDDNPALPLEMLAAWKTGDMATFEDIYRQTFKPTEMGKTTNDILITKRNKNWQGQLSGLLKDKSVLVAVGTLHFVGDHSLVNLLDQGFYQQKSW